jgi:ribose-phosphate pyrophosphokinase
MIKIRTLEAEYDLQPTIFPDGTSQIWKLPESIFRSHSFDVIWNYENEREVLDLLSLRKLLPLPAYAMSLHIPYLPYGRQDKEITNTSTFNLRVFADLINSLECYSVTSVDAHNPSETTRLIKRFGNIPATDFQLNAIAHSKPDYVVYPDAGAQSRYATSLLKANLATIVCDKVRHHLTGNIIGHHLANVDDSHSYISRTRPVKVLIVDDLCDGGATFINVAKMLKELRSGVTVDLCVTHGIFSRGLEHLYNNGIDQVFTTNSLTKNEGGYKV